ncbi:MAG: hypothetical protein IJC21_03820 [Lentisphaeria bacterium]|nr:hypothetical protein [Lentisphaeria bacterium]
MKKVILILSVVAAAVFIHADEVRIYRGNSTYSSDCIATYSDGRFYKGSSTYSPDCFATYHRNKLYRGSSTYSSDCVFTFSESVKYSPALLTWIAYNYFKILFL